MKRILREAADHLRVCGGIGAKQWGQPLRNNPATRKGMGERDGKVLVWPMTGKNEESPSPSVYRWTTPPISPHSPKILNMKSV